MLHGPIRVNGVTIAYWTAVRLERTYEPNTMVPYRCTVETDNRGEWEGTVLHIPDEGAMVLVAKIMQIAEQNVSAYRPTGSSDLALRSLRESTQESSSGSGG